MKDLAEGFLSCLSSNPNELRTYYACGLRKRNSSVSENGACQMRYVLWQRRCI